MTLAEQTEEPHGQSADSIDGGAAAGYWRHTLAALVSPGALALSAFALAVSGMVELAGPLGLIQSFSYNAQDPVELAKSLAYVGIGMGIVAIALAIWSLLRPESEPLWPRIVAGAAALLALLGIFQHAVVILVAANTGSAGSFIQ